LKSSPESTPKGTRKSNPGTFILSFSEMLEPFPTVRESGAGGVFPVRPWRRRLHISAEVEAVGCHVEARVPGGGVLRGLPGMIHGFDDGGDGRMSFPEFKRMMQNAA